LPIRTGDENGAEGEENKVISINGVLVSERLSTILDMNDKQVVYEQPSYSNTLKSKDPNYSFSQGMGLDKPSDIASFIREANALSNRAKNIKEQGHNQPFNGSVPEEIEALVDATNKTLNVIYSTFDLNSFGQVLHPLESEIQALINKAKDDKIFYPISYSKDVDGNPFNYLEKYFGRYLSYYNRGKGDFLYLDQIKNICGPSYYETLKKYITNNKKFGVIPTSKSRTESDARKISESSLPIIKNTFYNNNLIIHKL